MNREFQVGDVVKFIGNPMKMTVTRETDIANRVEVTWFDRENKANIKSFYASELELAK